MMCSAPAITLASVVALSRPASSASRKGSSASSSRKGSSPLLTRSTAAASMSNRLTRCPRLASAIPRGRPTCPQPPRTTASRVNSLSVRCTGTSDVRAAAPGDVRLGEWSVAIMSPQGFLLCRPTALPSARQTGSPLARSCLIGADLSTETQHSPARALLTLISCPVSPWVSRCATGRRSSPRPSSPCWPRTTTTSRSSSRDNASTRRHRGDLPGVRPAATAVFATTALTRTAVPPGTTTACWSWRAFPYFKWAAADDLCGPTFLSRCLEQMIDGGEGSVIAYPETTLIDVDGADMGPLDDSDLAVARRRSRSSTGSAAPEPLRVAPRVRSDAHRCPAHHARHRGVPDGRCRPPGGDGLCGDASGRCRNGCSSAATTSSAASRPGRASSSRSRGTTPRGVLVSPCRRPGCPPSS